MAEHTSGADELDYRLYGLTLRSSFPFRFHFEPSRETPDLLFVYHGVTEEQLPAGTRLTGGSREEGAPAGGPSDDGSPEDGSNEGGSRGEVMQLYRSGNAEIVYFPGIAAFRCLQSEIHAWAFAEGLEYLVEICLVGNVMAYWLERRGTLALHASAVVVRGGAVAFLAGTSRGKTTAACAFLSAGHALLTDDILPLGVSSQEVSALPGFPQMKLLPAQVDFLGLGTGDFKKVHPLFEKLMVPIGRTYGSFHDRSVPLAAVYLLDRDENAGAPGCTLLGRSEAFIELLRHSFAAELVDAIDRGRDRFGRISTAARLVPVKRLRLPAGYEHLDRVVSCVEEDLARSKISPTSSGPELVG